MRLALLTYLALVAALVAEVHADGGVLGPSCRRVEVAYVQGGELHYVEIKKSSGGPDFLVSKADLPSAGPEGPRTRAEVMAVAVPPEVGTHLLMAFDQLMPSDLSADYGYSSEPPLHGVHNYGLVRCDEKMVIACGISDRAVDAQTCESLKIAWWIQLVKGTLSGWQDHKVRSSKAMVGSALRQLLRDLPNTFEVPVCGYGEVSQWQGKNTIDAGELLRSAVARGLIYGDLVSDPGAAPEKELRLTAIERGSLELGSDKLRKFLLPFLDDGDGDVKFNAAYALAGLVDPKHQEVRRALERYLESESSADRRRWVENSMTEVEGAKTRRGRTP